VYIALLASFFAGVAVVSLIWLIVIIVKMQARIAKLEESKAKRLPYNVAMGLEDAALELVVLLSQDELRHEQAENVLSLVQRLRKDGTKYDADKPLNEIRDDGKSRNL